MDLDGVCQTIARTCACKTARTLSRRTTRLFESHLAPVELKAGQFTFLVVVRLLGPVSLSEVARRTGTDRTTLYRSVKPLVERGLVESIPGPDARTKHVRLTAAGRGLLRRAVPLWEAAQAEFLDAADAPRWERVRPELTAIDRAVAECLGEVD